MGIDSTTGRLTLEGDETGNIDDGPLAPRVLVSCTCLYGSTSIYPSTRLEHVPSGITGDGEHRREVDLQDFGPIFVGKVFGGRSTLDSAACRQA